MRLDVRVDGAPLLHAAVRVAVAVDMPSLGVVRGLQLCGRANSMMMRMMSIAAPASRDGLSMDSFSRSLSTLPALTA
jgi:hypothetical protein